MNIVIAGYRHDDTVGIAKAKNYVARNYPGLGHVVSNDTAGEVIVVTPEDVEAEFAPEPFLPPHDHDE